ncbi:MAG: M56 family metallopeptidase, partial [Bacteroidota bacterium]
TVEPKQPQKTFAFNLSSILPILGWIYLAGVLVFALHFLIQIGLLLVRMLRHPGYDLGRFRIVELNQEFAPYSFWNRIFLNPNCYDPETFHRIVEHEQIHVTQKHSIDILLAELLVVIQWFNPFAWFYRSAIEDNLEYLTDAEMIRQGTDPVEYQLSLVQVAIPNHPQGLTSNYNQTFLEKRITMMKAKKSSSRSGWKYLALLPILVFSVLQLNAVSDTSMATLQSADPTPPTTDYYSSTINGEVTTEDETVSFNYNLEDLDSLPSPSPNPQPTPFVSPDAVAIAQNAAQTSREWFLSPNPTPTPNPVPRPMPRPNPQPTTTVNIDFSNFSTEEIQKMRRNWTAEIVGSRIDFQLIVRSDNGRYSFANSHTFENINPATLPRNEVGSFTISNAAGNITFRGIFEGNEGFGTFDFTPDPSFVAELERRGYSGYKEMEMLHFILSDFSPNYIDAIEAEGYSPNKDQLLEMAIFGFNPDNFRQTLDDLESLGYEKPKLRKLIELRIHGINKQYVEELSRAGYQDLTLKDVINARIHGLSAEYVQGMAGIGFSNLSFNRILDMSIHGVSPEYVTTLRNYYPSLSPQKAIDARIHGISTERVEMYQQIFAGNLSLNRVMDLSIHGVSPEYVKSLREYYPNLTAQQAIDAKIHGVNPQKASQMKAYFKGENLSISDVSDMSIHGVDDDYIKMLASFGFTNLSSDDIVSAKIHGVTRAKLEAYQRIRVSTEDLDEVMGLCVHGVSPEFINNIRDLGYENLTAEDFVNARIHGVSPSFIRSFSDLGFGEISMDDLMDLRIHGVTAEFIKANRDKGQDIDDFVDLKIRGRW